MDEEQKKQFLLELIQAQEKAIATLDKGGEKMAEIVEADQINKIRATL